MCLFDRRFRRLRRSKTSKSNLEAAGRQGLGGRTPFCGLEKDGKKMNKYGFMVVLWWFYHECMMMFLVIFMFFSGESWDTSLADEASIHERVSLWRKPGS